MLPIHTILHPTDFSEYSAHAFRLASALARDYGARLIALHVLVPPAVVYGEGMVVPDAEQQRDEVRAQLEKLQALGGQVRVVPRLVEGAPVAEILRVAQETGADLILMGTHGRTGLRRLLMGSVAEQVVRQAACPVLTVKMPFPEAVPEQDKPVVQPAQA
jgi:nucleotide-binding universal stress UspA family protein